MLSALIELVNKVVPDKKVALRQRYSKWLPGFLKRQEEARKPRDEAKGNDDRKGA